MAENDAQEPQKVIINDKEYLLSDLSEKAKTQLANIRFVDKEIEDAKNQVSILQAARQYYAETLSKELPA